MSKQNTPTVNIQVESFSVNKTQEGMKVSGLALPVDTVSRNGFLYMSEGVKSKGKTLEGRPVLFNHDPEKVIGHVQSVEIGDKGLNYIMDLDTEGPYGWVARKVERGDLKNVSIQASYDPDKSFISDDGVTHAFLKEFYELSVVTIPGFADTTAQVMEKLRKTEVDNMAKEEKPKAVENDELKKEEETPKEDPKDESKESEPSVDDRVKALEETIKSLGDKVSAFEKRFEEYDKKAEEETPEDEKEKEEDEDKKVEEAIRKDKKTISAETYQKEIKNITAEDVKKLFMEG